MSTLFRRSAFVIALPLILLVSACSSAGGGASAPPSDAAAPSSAAAPSTGGGRSYDYDDGGASPSASDDASGSGGGEDEGELSTGTGADGAYLTGRNGMTLYIFKNDSANTSVCEGDCATNWPPLVVAADRTPSAEDGVTGKLTTFARADGSMQVAYDGKPLYYFAGDQAAGDTNGQGVKDVWFIAQP